MLLKKFKARLLGASIVVLGIGLTIWLTSLKLKNESAVSSWEIFEMNAVHVCSEQVTQWASIQKLKAEPDFPRFAEGPLPVEFGWLGRTNYMKVIIPPNYNRNVYVDVGFGGAFHRWGMKIGTTNLNLKDAPRGKAKLIKPGYLIYDFYD